MFNNTISIQSERTYVSFKAAVQWIVAQTTLPSELTAKHPLAFHDLAFEKGLSIYLSESRYRHLFALAVCGGSWSELLSEGEDWKLTFDEDLKHPEHFEKRKLKQTRRVGQELRSIGMSYGQTAQLISIWRPTARFPHDKHQLEVINASAHALVYVEKIDTLLNDSMAKDFDISIDEVVDALKKVAPEVLGSVLSMLSKRADSKRPDISALVVYLIGNQLRAVSLRARINLLAKNVHKNGDNCHIKLKQMCYWTAAQQCLMPGHIEETPRTLPKDGIKWFLLACVAGEKTALKIKQICTDIFQAKIKLKDCADHEIYHQQLVVQLLAIGNENREFRDAICSQLGLLK